MSEGLRETLAIIRAREKLHSIFKTLVDENPNQVFGLIVTHAIIWAIKAGADRELILKDFTLYLDKVFELMPNGDGKISS